MRALATIAAGWAGLGLVGANAAPPTLDALTPSGGQRGSEGLAVTALGKSDPWPVEVWCSNPGVTFEAGEKAGIFTVKITKEAEPGPCWVRTFNQDGASEPRIFVIGDQREMTEDASIANDGPGEATAVGDLPVVINGRLEKSQDVDAWKISLKKGETLRARLDGYSLRSGIDPFLHLYDPDGVRIALGNDNPKNLDPRLDVTAERDGDFVVAVMAIASPPNANVTFHGAAGAAYRLELSVGNSEEAKMPEGAKRIDAANAAPLSLPIEGFGVLEGESGEDRVRFSATKGQSLLVRADAVGFEFPTDPVMFVEKEDGSLIREVDDTKSDRDAEYLFKVPADGVYTARITDRFGRKGEGMGYGLSIAEAIPGFSATVDKSGYVGKPGESVEVKLTVVRSNGHAIPLVIEAIGLPEGVSAEPLTLDEKATSGSLTIKVSANAKPFSGGFGIRATEKTEGEKPSKSESARFSFQGSDARGPYLLDEIADLWLTIPTKSGDNDKKS
ncbi:MAG: hypothetical protein KDN19_19680 [Verrucomicrobiae bacterium]|nr:hypothetical protein [Verrucomicrobiae bacterium]